MPRPHFKSIPSFILMAAVCGALTAIPAGATPARIAALGGRGDFFTDEANVHRWCAVLGEYPGLVTLSSGWQGLNSASEPGEDVFRPGGGFQLGIGPEGRWATAGFFIDGRGTGSDPGSLVPTGNGLAVSGMIAHRWNGVLAALRYRRVSSEQEAAGFGTWTDLHQDIGAGLRLPTPGEGFLDLAGEIRGINRDLSSSVPQEGFPEGNAGDSWDGYGVRVRAFFPVGTLAAVVPVFEYATGTDPRARIDGSTVVPSTDLERLARVGCGLDVFPDLDNMLVLSAEYLDADLTVPNPLDSWYPVQRRSRRDFFLRLGMERRLAPWLVARAAAGFDHNLDSEPGAGDDTTERWPLSVGLSTSFGGTTLDVALRRGSPDPDVSVPGASGFPNHATWFMAVLRQEFQP
ncbi:MAG: hypothetical protein AB7V45_07510 [Candidatus Krumholzibacteriia bacterium]